MHTAILTFDESGRLTRRRLVDQEAWARQQAAANNASSDFWAATGLVLRQFDGLVAGYAARADMEANAVTGEGSNSVPRLTRADLLLVSAVGAFAPIPQASESPSSSAHVWQTSLQSAP